MNQRLFRILGGETKHYPYALESKFPRILNMIMSLWDSNEIDDYFMELMVSKRSGRVGFPPEIATEIMHLSLVHAAQEAPDRSQEVWGVSSERFVNYSPSPASEFIDPSLAIQTELQTYHLPATPAGIFEAIEIGNRTAVILYINAKISTETRDSRGWTPLMMAAFHGRNGILDYLVEHDADVNASDLGGNSALHWAAFGGHTECVKQLILHRAKISASNHFGWTPLMQAAARNHAQAVALLIDSGVNLDTIADDGYTALHKAAALGYSDIVKLLLDQGANKNIKAIDGDTPYKLALKNRQQTVIDLLAD
jgi:hypothetical protein